ncbi:MAG: hypothetical protein DCF19_00515 [Pseudanabaena frigida]|uniref:DUF2281 domain-containing protein n=1 Tax=Pseudanabaena frigida TaxID=945775 RepID=A0A2W4WKM6_9CYAN|nr:MAG: hypothetical protein DCF19_00515 [Pseudanabaena frigida]
MLPITTFQNIEKSLKQLPDSLQIEVLHYIEFLKSKYVKQIDSKNQSLDRASIETLEYKKVKKRDGFGIWQGQITMSEDFDAPMEEFEEYM